VKPEGGTADASRRFAAGLANGGNSQRELEVAAADGASLKLHRLGLDRETEFLVEAAGDGRAQQICVIRGILERLAEDQGVMERVRRRARELLARSDG